jgi:hypothetical protein
MPIPRSDISLRRQKDLSRVRILHRCPGMECVDIDIAAVRRKWTGDEPLFAGDGNPVRKIFLTVFLQGRSRGHARIALSGRRAGRFVWSLVRFRFFSRVLATALMRRRFVLWTCEHVLQRAEKLLQRSRFRACRPDEQNEKRDPDNRNLQQSFHHNRRLKRNSRKIPALLGAMPLISNRARGLTATVSPC